VGELSQLWPWVAIALLGAFHGLNPGMGWLFAVALGLQEGRERVVVTALGPIAAGHAMSIALVAVPVGLLGLVIAPSLLLAMGGLTLLGFAAFKVASRFRHPRWVGMRVGPRELVLWSFLMATAHGAGLMLAPAVAILGSREPPAAAVAADHSSHLGAAGHVSAADEITAVLGPAVMGTALHTVAMLLVMGIVAILVYRILGVELLRRAWINVDLIWVGVLAVAGVVALGLSIWPAQS
jgi:hypothetical protein